MFLSLEVDSRQSRRRGTAGSHQELGTPAERMLGLGDKGPEFTVL